MQRKEAAVLVSMCERTSLIFDKLELVLLKAVAEVITKAVKCRCFYLSKFLSAVLLSIAVALATAQSSALQIEIYSA